MYLCKEVCENVAGVLGFDHFGVVSIAYLGRRWEETEDRSRTVLGLSGIILRLSEIVLGRVVRMRRS